MKPCVICGDVTGGSVGAAGSERPDICQPCRDREDKALAVGVRHQGEVIAGILGAVNQGLPLRTEVTMFDSCLPSANRHDECPGFEALVIRRECWCDCHEPMDAARSRREDLAQEGAEA